MVYRASELAGIVPSPTGVIVVQRDPEDVFAQDAMDSFEGKPIVVDHPIVNGQIQLLTSDNWRQFAVGSMHNVRRGEGVKDNLLLADLLITDSTAISEVMAGRREVSCGYGAEYKQLDKGRAKQYDIRGNHLALVRQGRCGVACSIGDHEPMQTLEQRLAALRAERDAQIKAADDKFTGAVASMATGDNLAMPGAGAMQNVQDPSGRIIVNVHGAAKGAADAPVPGAAPAAPAAAPVAAPAGGMGGEGAQILALLQQLMAMLTEEDAEGEDDEFQTSSQSSEGAKPDIGASGEEKTEKKFGAGDQGDLTKAEPTRKVGEPMGKTGTGNGLPTGASGTGDKQTVADSSGLLSQYQEVVSRAEILVPGKTAPKFDAKQAANITLDSLCSFRRDVMATAMKDDKTKAIISSLVGDADFAKEEGAKVEMLFMGSSELVRAMRSQSKFQSGKSFAPTGDKKATSTIADINAAADRLWGRQSAA